MDIPYSSNPRMVLLTGNNNKFIYKTREISNEVAYSLFQNPSRVNLEE